MIPSQHIRAGRGFTLIELLVVITIIALLISILIPSLDRAREAARDAICKGRMRQVMVTVAAYQADTRFILPGYMSRSLDEMWYVGMNGPNMLEVGGYLPNNIVGQPDDWGLGARSTASWVNGYARSNSIFLCPSKTFYGKHDVRILGGGSIQAPGEGWNLYNMCRRDGESMSAAFGSLNGVPWTGAWTVPTSYTIVYAQSRLPAPQDHYQLVKDFKNPARKVYMMEASSFFANGAEDQWWWQHANYDWTHWYSFPHGLTNNSGSGAYGNFTAVDGHVGSVGRELAGLGYIPGNMPFDFYQ